LFGITEQLIHGCKVLPYNNKNIGNTDFYPTVRKSRTVPKNHLNVVIAPQETLQTTSTTTQNLLPLTYYTIKSNKTTKYMAEQTNPKPQTEVHAGDAQKTVPAKREEAVLSFWREHQVFQKSLDKKSPKGNFVFFDGPPYATGQPHYGHILASTLKDIVPRYKTMQGYNVPRKWGWDCHGLPIENLIEKELGLKDKKAIEEYGIDKFNKAAKESVLTYAHDWKRIIGKVGRWVDMDNDYHTMDSSYTESVWWSFNELNKKGLVYQAFKVMPYCPRCETSLSNFEVGQGYKDIPDISAYVLFEVSGDASVRAGAPTSAADTVAFLAWTTTPWTLPGNSALAVNLDLEYSLVAVDEKLSVWMATSVMPILLQKGILKSATSEATDDSGESAASDAMPKVIKTAKGSELVGLSYKPPFDFYQAEGSLDKDQETKRVNAWKVYGADFVTAEDGSGIVHIAPAFGDDDYKLATANNLPVIIHVDQTGKLKDSCTTLAGLTAKPKGDHQSTDIEVIKLLAHTKIGGQGASDASDIDSATSTGNPLLFAKEKLVHSYPHCWRCDTPLLNYATSSWFVKVTDMKDELIKANETVNWTPKEVGEGRFGKWLENVRDWAISRTRYWGAPLPVWKGDKTGKVVFIDSVEKLKEKIAGNGNTYMVMRHGQSFSNVKDVINSSEKDLDLYPLTEKGIEEVKKSAELIKDKQDKDGKKVTKIYASDFIRTRQTAEIVAEALGIDKKDIVLEPRLREINGGDFDGGDWGTRANFFSNMYEKIFKRSPNGESVDDVRRRTAEFLYEIDSSNQNESVLVVTHGLPLRIMLGTSNGVTSRDLVRSKWQDFSEPTASVHDMVFKQLPHDANFELDLHRPHIDKVTWTQVSPDGETETMTRIPDVFDVWYDSGSMSFAQNHYPFENKDLFEEKDSILFPADLISEGLDQTRGWFYSLMVLSVALFGKSPYKNVVVNGLILAEDGRKMSKSLKNYPDIEPTLDKYGADSLRFMLASSPATHAEEVAFSEKALDEVNKKIFNRLENVYSFYKMYSGDVKVSAYTDEDPESENVLDKWVLSRLSELKDEIEKNLDMYQIDKATRPISLFVDDVSTWYLRRSRDRFKGDNEVDKKQAIETTRFVLVTLSKLLAPFVPFMAEHMYQNIRNSMIESCELDANRLGKNDEPLMPLSVHLCDWPSLSIPNESILISMDNVRSLVESGLAMRSSAGIKVRQPLASFTYDKKLHSFDQSFESIIAEELNVKKVSSGDENNLDVNLTEDLREEGLVRDIIRAVQESRKNAGLNPQNFIELKISSDDATQAIVEKYQEMIKKPVQAVTIETATLALTDGARAGDISDESDQNEILDLDGVKVQLQLRVTS
jgi:isoleucyl-tRNA synthetase